MAQSEVFERKNAMIWRVSTRRDSRTVTVVECHQSNGMKEVPD